MRKYGYLIVEGPHDAEFAYRLLTPFKLKRIQLLEKLDPFFLPLIPKEYPPNGDLLKRVPVPLFLQNDTHSIAIHNAGGDSRLIPMLEETDNALDLSAHVGVGFLLDSDKPLPAEKRYYDIKEQLAKVTFMNGKTNFVLGDELGTVAQGQPKLGAFVLPDNVSAGTLEDLLLDGAKYAYPLLLASATRHVSDAYQNPELHSVDLEEMNKPAGQNKAIIGAMSSVLRPGKAVQVSIQDNRWLRGEALLLPRIKAVQDFLKILFELH